MDFIYFMKQHFTFNVHFSTTKIKALFTILFGFNKCCSEYLQINCFFCFYLKLETFYALFKTKLCHYYSNTWSLVREICFYVTLHYFRKLFLNENYHQFCSIHPRYFVIIGVLSHIKNVCGESPNHLKIFRSIGTTGAPKLFPDL